MQNLHLVSTIILLFATFLLLSSTSTATTNRRLLHQPFFQLDQPTIAQPPYPSPTPQPQPQEPKYPFSSFSPPNPTTTTQTPFFPFTPSQPPPTHQSSTTTFPANISSLILPSSSSSHSSTHKTIKLISLILSLSLFTFLLFTSLLFILYRHRHRHHLKTDTLHLFPPDSTPSDTTDKKPPPPLFPRHTPTTSNSSEFLYLGTLVSPRDVNNVGPALTPRKSLNPTVSYQRLGSPELHPLPPLPRQPSQFNYQNNSPENDDDYSGRNKEEEYEHEEFFSPRGSTGNKLSPTPLFNDFTKSRSLDSSNSCSPSVVLDSGTPRSTELSSPEILLDNFSAPLPRSVNPPPSAGRPRAFSIFSPSSTEECSPRASDFSCAVKVTEPPRPPPPPPQPRLSESAGGPSSLVGLSGEVVNGVRYSVGNSDEIGKPKLKPLHWDKMRACSDKAMVWDQLKSSSFELNEQMIETLFMVSSSSTMNAKEGVRRQIISDTSQESLVLDPKKSQNIAILLRALNVTTEEVCEGLMEGNADTLGSELLESLLKMAPTKEEERKLKEFKDDDSPFKLGIAETFLKAMLDIPYAFKRVQAMLYVSNFESEVEYLKMSFATLECACKELKSSRMFCKLLEAVLRTGNRMNVGTNRGDAHAFKLDSLLKLLDVKGGSDGKTTLLHFVVQEIIRTEGARFSGTEKIQQQSTTTLQDEDEYRKIGLQIVSALSGELTNVKKAATMDADVLSNDVVKITTGINQILEVLKLNEELLGVNHNTTKRFNDCMNEFLRNAQSELVNLQAEEGIALSTVKELTEYFHGDSAKEEARPFRLFMVVRDFLSILDQVCKDVDKMNQRTMISSCRQNQTPENNNNPIILRQLFPTGISETHSSSDDD